MCMLQGFSDTDGNECDGVDEAIVKSCLSSDERL